MANVIGTLLVELGVNTVAFTEGLGKATYAARAGAQQVGSSLRGIGSALGELGSEFGVFGGVVGSALSAVGANLSKLAKEFVDVGGAAGALKAAGAGAVALGAGFVTASAAVVGIAVHAAEGAARLHELSQSTGVAVQTLSGLSIVGRLVGVDVETLSKGLERMDRTALTAATGSARAGGAFKTLGISVTDSNGKLKPTAELFGEVADKFSGMEDGATKTALAMQIFGRAGANLIPVLNKGSEAMKYWVDYGAKVGAVLDDKAAEGAHNFEEQMTKLGLISTGVQNKLMEALLPAIDHITVAFTTFAEKGNTIASFGAVVGRVLVALAKLVFEAAYAWDWWSAKIDIWQAKFAKATFQALSAAGYLKQDAAYKKYLDEQDKTVKDREAGIRASADRLAIELADLESKGTVPAGPGEKKGAKSAAPGITAQTGLIKAPVDEVAKYIDTLGQEVAAQAKFASSIGKTTEEIRAQEAQLAAEEVVIKMREGLVAKQDSLERSLANAKAEGNARATKTIEEELKFVTNEIRELDDSKATVLDLLEAKRKVAEDTAFQKSMVAEHEKIQAEIAGLEEETEAVFRSAAAKREAAAGAAVAKFTAGRPGTDTAQLLQDQKDLQDAIYQKKVAEEAASLSTTKGYADQVALIKEVMAEYKDNRDIQLAGAAALQSAQNKVTQAWDANALAVGTFADRTKAVLNQLALESQNVGGRIAESFKKFFDGVSDQFAKMVVTGKYNFAALFDSLEEQIIKELASKALSDLLNKLGNLLNNSADNSDGGGGGGVGGFFGSVLGALGFGGGKAGGGDVTPGMSYLVGEQGPERFVPDTPGKIVPNGQLSSGSGGMSANITLNVHGVTDVDSFRRSAPQVTSGLYRSLTAAYAHNGGS